jgi:A/G-specific adenine glycosylase
MHDFSLQIAEWYRQNKRSLPWRESTDPFQIWLSEVILQQTRVDQGLPYYVRFTETFQNISELANASEQEVLRLWQGLGYYSRGRNLHYTAKQISREFSGKFPEKYDELIKLKGIGTYTAAAIASFCFGEVVPVIDGNVQRVISRFFNISLAVNSSEGVKIVKSLANELISPKDPATHNQAIMELGALVCTPRNPSCTLCPVADNCISRQKNTIHERPVKLKKTSSRKRYFHYAIIEKGGFLLIQKRLNKDIWLNMYEFPLTETLEDQIPVELNPGIKSALSVRISEPVTHVLSHQKIIAKFYHFKIEKDYFKEAKDCFYVKKEDLTEYPIPRLIDKYLDSEDDKC